MQTITDEGSSILVGRRCSLPDQQMFILAKSLTDCLISDLSGMPYKDLLGGINHRHTSYHSHTGSVSGGISRRHFFSMATQGLSLAESTIARLTSDCLHRWSVGHQSPAMAIYVTPSLTGSPPAVLLPIQPQSPCPPARHQTLGTTSAARSLALYPSSSTLRLLLHLPFTPSPDHSHFFYPPSWALSITDPTLLSTHYYAQSLERTLEYASAGNTSNSQQLSNTHSFHCSSIGQHNGAFLLSPPPELIRMPRFITALRGRQRLWPQRVLPPPTGESATTPWHQCLATALWHALHANYHPALSLCSELSMLCSSCSNKLFDTLLLSSDISFLSSDTSNTQALIPLTQGRDELAAVKAALIPLRRMGEEFFFSLCEISVSFLLFGKSSRRRSIPTKSMADGRRFLNLHRRRPRRLTLAESTIATHIRLPHRQSIENATQAHTHISSHTGSFWRNLMSPLSSTASSAICRECHTRITLLESTIAAPHITCTPAQSLAEYHVATSSPQPHRLYLSGRINHRQALSSDCLHQRSVGHQCPAMAIYVAPSLTGSPRLTTLSCGASPHPTIVTLSSCSTPNAGNDFRSLIIGSISKLGARISQIQLFCQLTAMLSLSSGHSNTPLQATPPTPSNYPTPTLSIALQLDNITMFFFSRLLLNSSECLDL
eukprot:Gb_33609 [translate_table: standard]